MNTDETKLGVAAVGALGLRGIGEIYKFHGLSLNPDINICENRLTSVVYIQSANQDKIETSLFFLRMSARPACV
ncbi:MAG: hypothetical protein JXR70_13245 [Spirochaetales bacterium]|nr:hypothetical protein [Spirochaetales bacterium]